MKQVFESVQATVHAARNPSHRADCGSRPTRAAMCFLSAVTALVGGCGSNDPSPGQQDFTYTITATPQTVAPGATSSQQLLIVDRDVDEFGMTIDDGSPFIGEVGLAAQGPAPGFGLTLGGFAPPSLVGTGSSALTLNAADDAALAIHQLVIEGTLLNVSGLSASDRVQQFPVDVRVTASCVSTAVRATAIAAGRGFGCCSARSGALAEDGSLYTWGGNASGIVETGVGVEIAVPTVRSWLAPVRVPLPAFDNLSALALRSNRLYVLRGGVVHTTGSYFHTAAEAPDGQPGFATGMIAGIPVPVTAVAPEFFHSLALGVDGSVWAWGDNAFGALGDGTTVSSAVPVQAVGLSNVIAIAAGNHSSVALRADGMVWTWGGPGGLRLGDGTSSPRLVPGPVGGLSDITAIASSPQHVLALRRDGSVWSWGANGNGQLGDGTDVSRPTPVQVSGLSNVTALATGPFHSLAVRSDGTVWSWGSNNTGELGDGSAGNIRMTPVQAVGLGDAVAVAAGLNHSLALRSDGSVWAWGENEDGELGDGTTMNRLTPVPVLGFGPSVPSFCSAPPPGQLFMLTVIVDGNGEVFSRDGNEATGQPPSLFCLGDNDPNTPPVQCQASYAGNTTVTLTPISFNPNLPPGAFQASWQGCLRITANGDCEVLMDGSKSVTATIQ